MTNNLSSEEAREQFYGQKLLDGCTSGVSWFPLVSEWSGHTLLHSCRPPELDSSLPKGCYPVPFRLLHWVNAAKELNWSQNVNPHTPDKPKNKINGDQVFCDRPKAISSQTLRLSSRTGSTPHCLLSHKLQTGFLNINPFCEMGSRERPVSQTVSAPFQ